MPITNRKKAEQKAADMSSKKEEGKSLILEALKLPAPSVAVNRILKVAGDGHANAPEMAEAISRDSTLTANILKVANSACFGLSQEVPTVSRAIVVLGFEAVKSIALSASVIEAFHKKASQSSFDRTRFWTHSLACAYLAKRIAGMTHRTRLETGFVCGLLHDIGKIVLDSYFPDSYNRVLSRLSAGGVTSVEAEDEVLGFSHPEVGMWVTQQWRFAKTIVFTIANHHGVICDDARYRHPTAIVRLANHLCRQEGINLTDGASIEPLAASAIVDLSLDREDVADLREELTKRKDSLLSLFSNWK
ncbi:HDOD domain-containing protein [Candidatus Poribacteria bacterium]|nr:HDOD domain-containing protein [Candidatus Poribacteria bacterium]